MIKLPAGRYSVWGRDGEFSDFTTGDIPYHMHEPHVIIIYMDGNKMDIRLYEFKEGLYLLDGQNPTPVPDVQNLCVDLIDRTSPPAVRQVLIFGEL